MHNRSQASRPRRISSPDCEAPAEEASRHGAGGSLPALLADDDALFRSLLRAMLARHFPEMSVAEAADGWRAAALAEMLRPQWIFMDINLPGRNGLDLTREFKASDPGILVCLFTDYDLPEYRIAARECGADQVIVKEESTEAAIVAMVEAQLSGHSERAPTELHDERACVSEPDGP